MTRMGIIFLVCLQSFLSGCAVKTPLTNQYQLSAYSSSPILEKRHPKASLLISQPEAVAGYQTEQMLYIKNPFELEAFSKNAWVSSPSNMLLPLIVQSMQNSHYFFAVATTPYADKADYRLDTQLLELHQNFLVKPSAIQLAVKVVLTHVEDNRIIASRILRQCVKAPEDTPYGGVLAANQATQQFTKALTDFVINHLKPNSLPQRRSNR